MYHLHFVACNLFPLYPCILDEDTDVAAVDDDKLSDNYNMAPS